MLSNFTVILKIVIFNISSKFLKNCSKFDRKLLSSQTTHRNGFWNPEGKAFPTSTKPILSVVCGLRNSQSNLEQFYREIWKLRNVRQNLYKCSSNESTLGFLDNLEKSFVKDNWYPMVRLGLCYNIIVSKPHGGA